MTFEAMLEEERDEAREEGLFQGRNEGRAEAERKNCGLAVSRITSSETVSAWSAWISMGNGLMQRP